MNFQEMYSTSMLFGTQAFPNTRYNVLFKKLLLRCKIGVFSSMVLRVIRSNLFFFSKCDINKDSVAYNVVGIVLFSYEKLTNLDQLAPRTNLPRSPLRYRHLEKKCCMLLSAACIIK